VEAGAEAGMTVKEKLRMLVDQLDDAQARAVLTLVGRLGETDAITGELLTTGTGRELSTMPGQTFQAQFHSDLSALAASQEVGPITNFDELLGDFRPENETADQFVAAVRKRHRGGDYTESIAPIEEDPD
jgi:hypothetical protein